MFFYNLGGYSLVDFDEAWFAEIARNVLVTHNPILMYFNGKLFVDHPPIGYDLMAISMYIFGTSEFGARFPSALLGFLSIILIYFVGKNLFNRTVGLGASLILVSCVWFTFRARSGNLDAILMFFFLLSLYLAIKLKNSSKYAIPLSLSLAALFLTKTLIGFMMVIPIGSYLILNKVRLPTKKAIVASIILLAILSIWFVSNILAYGTSFPQRLTQIGLRTGNGKQADYLNALNSQTLLYLHYGVRKWYYFSLISLPISFLLTIKNKNVIPVFLWAAILLLGYLNNASTEIWHMIPLYAPLALLTALVTNYIVTIGANRLKSHLNPNSKASISTIIFILTILPITVLAAGQIYGFRNEIKLTDTEKSGLSQTAADARNTSEDLYLDSDLIVPAVAAFYSQKHVTTLISNPAPKNSLKGQMAYGTRPFLLITETWRLNTDKIDPASYIILSEHRGHVLIKVVDPSQDGQL